MKIQGEIKSDIGFYIGDPVYVFSEDDYNTLWGDVGFNNGIHPAGELSWAVASASDRDGSHYDDYGREYVCDTASLALIPMEYVSVKTELGYFFNCPGTAEFLWEDDVFTITLPTGETRVIK